MESPKYPLMKEIEKLAKKHNAELQSAVRKIEKAIERFENKMKRKEEELRQAYKLKGAELEKKIQEIAKENGMVCYIGNGSYRDEKLIKTISKMGGISFKRPSGEPGSVTIFPPGTKEEPIRPDLPPSEANLVVIVSPNGYYTFKCFIEDA
jgi:hypothetical protein